MKKDKTMKFKNDILAVIFAFFFISALFFFTNLKANTISEYISISTFEQLENGPRSFAVRKNDYLMILGTSQIKFHLLETADSVSIDMIFPGSNERLPEGITAAPGRKNYISGNDRQHWRRNITHYEKVGYREIFDGIDMELYTKKGLIEYDFIVKPFAEHSQIRMEFKGAEKIRIDQQGSLLVKTGAGILTNVEPFAYQVKNGQKNQIEASYTIRDRVVSFRIGDYDPALPLIIDPILNYSALIGGDGATTVKDVLTDEEGYIYITGTTIASPNTFPIKNAYQSQKGGNMDAYLAKLDPDGMEIIYCTYLGGTGNYTQPLALAIDPDGRPVVAGYTVCPGFPVVNELHGWKNSVDGFISVFTEDGSDLFFSTFLGGTNSDGVHAIDFNEAGYLVLTGNSQSSDFPIVPSGSTKNSGGTDIILAVVDYFRKPSRIVASRYFGGSNSETGVTLDIGLDNTIYIGGYTQSYDFYYTPDALDKTVEHKEAFLSKFSADLKNIDYSTLWGGSGSDDIAGIVVDSTGAVFITGTTQGGIETTSNSFSPRFNGGNFDAFITVLDSTLNAVTYSSFLGGPTNDEGIALAASNAANIYITGHTFGNFPEVNSMPREELKTQPNADIFTTQINTMVAPQDQLVFSTTYGSSAHDYPLGNALFTKGREHTIHIVGKTDGGIQFPAEHLYGDPAGPHGPDGFFIGFDTDAEPAGYVRISGQVMTPNRVSVSGVRIEFEGVKTVTTDANGEYHVLVPQFWSGVSRPINSNFSFEPQQRSYYRIAFDRDEENYIARGIRPSISGRITCYGAGLADIAVEFTGAGSCLTDSRGYYYKVLPQETWSGSIIPQSSDFNFLPAQKVLSNLTGTLENVDFEASPSAYPVITGRIYDNYTQAGVEGVLITGNGLEPAVTDHNGRYLLKLTSSLWSGTITPSKSGLSFYPEKRKFYSVRYSLTNIDFEAFSNNPSISGKITVDRHDGNGPQGLEFVKVSFSNGGGSVFTDSEGRYTAYVPKNVRNFYYRGIATPTKPGFVFDPQERVYDELYSSVANQNYTTETGTAAIAGTVFDSRGSGLSDVVINFSNHNQATITDTGGHYSIDVPLGYYGTATPQPRGSMHFTPEYRQYASVTQYTPNQDYEEYYPDPVISGQIKVKAPSGITSPLPGVTVVYGDTGRTITDENGKYAFSVPVGYSGIVKCEMQGCYFQPYKRAYQNVTKAITSQNYTAFKIIENLNVFNGTGNWSNSHLWSKGRTPQLGEAALICGKCTVDGRLPLLTWLQIGGNSDSPCENNGGELDCANHTIPARTENLVNNRIIKTKYSGGDPFPAHRNIGGDIYFYNYDCDEHPSVCEKQILPPGNYKNIIVSGNHIVYMNREQASAQQLLLENGGRYGMQEGANGTLYITQPQKE